jgi:hypothetical protein
VDGIASCTVDESRGDVRGIAGGAWPEEAEVKVTANSTREEGGWGEGNWPCMRVNWDPSNGWWFNGGTNVQSTWIPGSTSFRGKSATISWKVDVYKSTAGPSNTYYGNYGMTGHQLGSFLCPDSDSMTEFETWVEINPLNDCVNYVTIRTDWKNDGVSCHWYPTIKWNPGTALVNAMTVSPANGYSWGEQDLSGKGTTGDKWGYLRLPTYPPTPRPTPSRPPMATVSALATVSLMATVSPVATRSRSAQVTQTPVASRTPVATPTASETAMATLSRSRMAAPTRLESPTQVLTASAPVAMVTEMRRLGSDFFRRSAPAARSPILTNSQIPDATDDVLVSGQLADTSSGRKVPSGANQGVLIGGAAGGAFLAVVAILLVLIRCCRSRPDARSDSFRTGKDQGDTVDDHSTAAFTFDLTITEADFSTGGFTADFNSLELDP